LRRSRAARRLALVGCLPLGLIAAGFVLVIGLALLSPSASVPVPPACTGAASGLPSSRNVAVPGAGIGTLLAADADTSVVVVASSGQSPAGATAYVMATQGDAILRTFPISSDAVVAAIADGVVVLFDDKIGYFLRTSDGSSVSRLFESDNYRGLYASGASRHLQMDAEITAVGFDGSVFTHVEVRFAGIADGCYFAAAAG
jgi:hypothetical protein